MNVPSEEDYSYSSNLMKLLSKVFQNLRDSEQPPRETIVIDEPIWYVGENHYELHNTELWHELNRWVCDMGEKGIDGISFSKSRAKDDPYVLYFNDVFP